VRNFACLLAGLLAVAAIGLLFAQDSGKARQISLPTTKVLTVPAPGRVAATNSFPSTVALSPDGRYAALLNGGFGTQEALGRQSIAILDLKSNQLSDFPDDRLGEESHQSYFLGLAFGSDGQHLYASIGSLTDPAGEKPGNLGNGIAVYGFKEGKVAPERFLRIPQQKLAAGKRVAYALRHGGPGDAIPYPAGLAVIAGQGTDRLLVADNLSDDVVLLDSSTGNILQRFDVSTHDIVPSSFPYTVVASREGRRAWCSLWNSSAVVELDLVHGTVMRSISLLEPKDAIAPGSHPTALLLSPDEQFLYVALSNTDWVAIVSVDRGQTVRLLNAALPGQNYAGTYPNALAQSADGKLLFVADASLNAVAVFDMSAHSDNRGGPSAPQLAMGFIPSEWYPSALAVAGDDLMIASAKGEGTGPNNFPGKLQWERKHRETAYIPSLLTGSVARVYLPQALSRLEGLTQQVEQDNLLSGNSREIKFTRGANPIRHVIYIIKENRTFDQVLGDLKVGDGDPRLTMYGTDITPNLHKLALQFGVLDNFYDSGEVSGDGHEWSTAAITSDYNEKTWQIAYRSKERTYDFGGMVADEFPLDLGEPDVDAPASGYLWDNVASHGLTYRDYGEFIAAIWCRSVKEKSASPKGGTPSPVQADCERPAVNRGERLTANVGMPHGGPSPWPWPVPLMSRMKATKSVLREHFDPRFPDFNVQYPDQLRADEFLNEFGEFVAARDQHKGAELPAFVLLYLPNDHTNGKQPGKPTPAASVADNDLAVGRVVEAVSHSPYWDDTAIFIVEDDAQDGADHVDAHRSIAFVISKYSPGSAAQPFVDHHFYTTVNMIHTLEALLNLPPMNQNDGYAPLMAPLFSGSGNQPAFIADWSNRDNRRLYEMNPPKGPDADASAELDFSRPDAANSAVLNAILWRDRKGNAPMPPATHAGSIAKDPAD